MFGQALGLAPGSRAQLWRRLQGIETFTGNVATDYGIEHETDAISALEEVTKQFVMPASFYVHKEFDWLGCSPDGFLGDDAVVEVKCPFSQTHYADIPLHYMAQIQGQMEIVDRPRCVFACWTSEAIKIWHVRRSPEYWEWAFPKLAEFWSFVLSGNEPPRFKKKPVPPELDLVEAEQTFLL